MINKVSILNSILDTGVVAVLRSQSEEEALTVTNACVRGGVNVIEVTFSVPNADLVIKEILMEFQGQNVIVGAGTVLDEVTARIAILAGAQFIVGPTFNKDVAKMCNLYGIPYIPGCMTINEIGDALRYGVEVIKLFPGNQFDYSYIKSIKAPLPQVTVMVTGGVDLSNVQDWIKNGASIVGVGGNLTCLIDDEGLEVEKLAKQYVEKVKLAREI